MGAHKIEHDIWFKANGILKIGQFLRQVSKATDPTFITGRFAKASRKIEKMATLHPTMSSVTEYFFGALR
ncbi:MAG: hypothetical protein P0S96_01790 [Simkaniaceae bacterium]|nr:hypothetical protein [Candidatus Sacchlamyda saccharinae]